MAKGMSLEDLKDFIEEESFDLPEISDKSALRKYSKNIALTIGFLLGVHEEQLVK